MARAVLLAAAVVLLAGEARADGLRAALDVPGAPTEAATLEDLARPAVRVFRDRDGLPENAVMSIARDHRGVLWVATQDGAASYDGLSWTTLNMPGRNLSNFVRVVFVDHTGAVWFGRESAGLARYEDSAFTTFDTSAGLPSGRVNAIVELGDSLFVATEKGIARRDHGAFRVYGPADGIPGDVVRPLAVATDVDGSRTVYAGTAHGVVALRGGGDRFEKVDGAPDGEIFALAETSGPELWVGTSHGVARRRAGAWRTTDASSGLPSNDVNAIAETTAADGSHAVYVGTELGVARLQHERWTTFRTEGLFSSPSIWSMAVVPETGPTDTLWIGADGGLARLHFGGWQSLDLPTASNSVFTTLVTQEHDHDVLWLGMRGSGLLRFADGAWTQWKESDGLVSSTVYALAETTEADGESLWVGTLRGVSRYVRGRFDPPAFPGLTFRQMIADRGRVFGATGKGGVRVHENGAWTKVQGLPTEDTYGVFVSHARSGDEELWVATDGKGVGRRVNDAWTFFDHANSGLANDTALSVYVRDGARRTLWVGTEGGGVSVLDLDTPGARFSTYDDATDPALPNGTIYQIREDAKGRVYLFTNGGVGRVVLAPDGVTAQSVDAFGTEDGLPSNEFNGSAADVDAHGRVWGGTIGGVTFFDPSLELAHGAPAPIVLEHGLSPGASLAYDASSPSFSFSLVTLFRGEDSRYRTELVGLEDAPSAWGTDRKRDFTKLPEGAYAFRVWARDHDGRVSGPLEIPFRVRPAPWRTWWAFTAYAAVGCALAWALIRYRVYALERRNRELAARVHARTRELATKVRELAVSEERAREAEHAAMQANRAKSAFLSTMSHELRTPLNAILGFAQLVARDRGLSPDHKENVDVIQKSGEHLLGMINDVLSIAKIEAGEVLLEERGFDVDQVVRDAARMVEGRARTKKISLRVESAPLRVRGDPGRVRQILLNLLANAVKFTEKGGVVVRATRTEARVRFEVEDTGPGIAEAELSKLFAPFVQSKTGARSQEGTGLGLSISRSLARQMGGDVTATSTPGVGTIFVIELRLPAEEEAAPASAHPAALALAPGCGPFRVVVADDVEENRRLLAKLLGQLGGFEVREAKDGAEAVRAWEAFHPHVVFLDYRMDGLDGPAAARAIRAKENGTRTALIALSASAFEEDRQALLAAGCDAFVGKPFAAASIVAALERHAGARFVYQAVVAGGANEHEAAGSALVSAARLSSLPAELREALLGAARAGDLRAARAAVAAVERLDADLGRTLKLWVDAFRLEDIEALVAGEGEGRDREHA